jgi:hypothetical protein
MAIAAVATQLVCMVSKTNVQLGMLKAKVKFSYFLFCFYLLIYFRWMHFHHIFKNHYVKYPKAITNLNIRIVLFIAVNDTSSGQESIFFLYFIKTKTIQIEKKAKYLFVFL